MKVLILSDGIALTTGFARVAGHLADAMVARGDDVYQIATGDQAPHFDSRPYYARGVTPFAPDGDHAGYGILGWVLDRVEPDVCLIHCDPGAAWGWLMRLKDRSPKPRTVLYAPVEGAPVMPKFCDSFAMADRAATFSEWSALQLYGHAGLEVDAIPHGVDLDLWHPLSQGERNLTRSVLNWGDDQFVVAAIGTNCRRKAQDRILRALVLLKQSGLAKNLRVYLGCQSFDHHNLEGWDLGWLAEAWGVKDRVAFSPDNDQRRGEPVEWVARKIGACDLFLHPATVEGFGLPILEAMACGRPIACTDDGGNMRELLGDAAYAWMRPKDWSTSPFGAQHAVVGEQTIAGTIECAMGEPDGLYRASKRALERAQLPEFRWETMVSRVLALVNDSFGSHGWRRGPLPQLAGRPVHGHPLNGHDAEAAAADLEEARP